MLKRMIFRSSLLIVSRGTGMVFLVPLFFNSGLLVKPKFCDQKSSTKDRLIVQHLQIIDFHGGWFLPHSQDNSLGLLELVDKDHTYDGFHAFSIQARSTNSIENMEFIMREVFFPKHIQRFHGVQSKISG